MKSIFLLIGMLALAVPAHAGTSVFVSIGGGGHFQGSCFGGIGSRCAYSAGCYNPYRSCGYVGYPGYFYGGYGYGYYGGYAASYYPVSYSDVPYAPAPPVAPVTTPAPSPAPPEAAAASPAPTAPPAPAPLLFGILDVNGFIHSPYSDATFKVPNVRNAQMVYDPVTGKPFLVR